jgi:hypothetical protein
VLRRIVLFWNVEISPEEEKEIIEKAAKAIKDRGMETPAILFLQTMMPMSIIGGQMGRVFTQPFLMFLGDNYSVQGEKITQVFEKADNIERLIFLLEERDKVSSKKLDNELSDEKESTKKNKSDDRWWKRLWPF